MKCAIPDVQIGTEKAVESAKKHALKGCWSDPLPIEKMNVSIDPDDHQSGKLRVRSTSGGESNSKREREFSKVREAREN
jgi:hypothetical protein